MKKIKKAQSIFLVLVMIMSLFSGLGITAGAVDTAYTGQTEAGTYSISTAAQLAAFASAVNAGTSYAGSTFTLTSNINLSASDTSGSLSWTGGTEWTPIAWYTADAAGTKTSCTFNGIFDGGGHYVNNITINKNTAVYEGYSLFGVVGTSGTIENLGVTGTVACYRSAAGIVSENFGTVTNCFSKVTVTSNGGGGQRGSGGIVGHNEGTVSYCINAGAVSNAYEQAGGIVGYNNKNDSPALIDHCFNVGAVATANADKTYEGAVAGTNGADAPTAGTISNCFYLKGSATYAVGLDKAAASGITAFNANAVLLDSNGNPTATTLINALDGTNTYFITAGAGAYPVLVWQSGYQWDTYTVVIAATTGGTFAATVNGQPISGASNKLVAGTTVVLTASAADPDYLFTGFTATIGAATANLGGTAAAAPYAKTYTVTSNVTLGVSYIATSSNVLTISTRAGLHGKTSVLKTETWNDLLGAATTYNPGYGYMYTHGADGWNIIAATQFVPLSTLFGDTVSPKDSDYIIASANDGSPSVIPTWGQLKGDLYFFPEATASVAGGSIANKIAVPSALALIWVKTSVDTTNPAIDTAAEALDAAAPSAYNYGSLRFVYGSTESDYTTLTSMSTIQGNRLWSGVTDISDAAVPTPYTGSIIPAPLQDYAGSTPYYTYGVTYDSVTQTAAISASGLVAFKKSAGDASALNWVGLAIPIPSGTVASDFSVGTNNAAISNAGKTGADLTTGGINYVTFYWDYLATDAATGSAVKYIEFSFDGGITVYEIAVNTAGIITNDVSFCGVGLTLDMMKAHTTTAPYTMNGTPYTVTGITIADILKYYAPNVKPAALQFGTSTATVYNCTFIDTANGGTIASPKNTGYDWSQTMLIWSQRDGTGAEKITSGLKSAVNGGTGKMWWSGVTTVTKKADAALTLKSTDGLFSDRFVSLAQLQEHPTTDTAGWVKNSKTPVTYTSITGIKLGDLLSCFIPNASYASGIVFYDIYNTSYSNMFNKAIYSGTAAGMTGGDFDNGMLAWSTNVGTYPSSGTLSSALNGGSGKYWWNNVNTAAVTMSNIITFAVTPVNAAVVVKDSSNATVAPVEPGMYILANGSYTYTVTATGYTAKTDSVTEDGANQTVTVSLDAAPGGGGSSSTYTITGYSGSGSSVQPGVSSAAAGDTVTLTVAPASGYVLTKLTLSSGTIKESFSSARTAYTFTMPAANVTVTATFDAVALTIYTKSGSNGTSVVTALYSRSQLEDLSTTTSSPTTGYIYYKDSKWSAVVATQYVPLDTLLSDAGIDFASGDSIASTASDDFNDTVSYSNVMSYKYYFDPNNSGASTVAPYIIALKHYVGTLTGSSLSAIVTGSATTSLRSCYGCSEDQYKNNTAYGRRLVSLMTSLTVIKAAVVNTNTNDGIIPGSGGSGVLGKEEKAEITVAGVTTGGVTSVTPGGDAMDSLISGAKAAEKDGNSALVSIIVTGDATTASVHLTIPGSAFASLASDTSAVLEVSTGLSSITFPSAAVDSISKAAGGSDVSIRIDAVDRSTLSTDTQKTVGDRPVYDFSISAGGRTISTFGSTVTVNVPYTLQTGEDPNTILIYYIAADGTLTPLPVCLYDAATGSVTFNTTHFSRYGVACNKVIFPDVSGWYADSVNFLSARGILSGTGNGTFNPDGSITRAAFVTILANLSGADLSGYTVSTFSDVRTTDWYFKAAQWASVNSLVLGSEGKFSPNDNITRQDIAVILSRYTVKFGLTLPSSSAAKTFSDTSSIATYAAAAVTAMQKAGVISGYDNGNFGPLDNATRAQSAKIIAVFVQDMVS